LNEAAPAAIVRLPGARAELSWKYVIVCEGVSGGEYVFLLETLTVWICA
jgi:hypothetical protein